MCDVIVSVARERPETGVLIARALASAEADLRLTALLHGASDEPFTHDVFDRIWAIPSWNRLQDDGFQADLAGRLDEGAVLLPSSPHEALWLADNAHHGVLAPPVSSVRKTGRPAPPSVLDNVSTTPAWISVNAPVEDIHAFGRRHNWTLSLRAPTGQRRDFDHWSYFDTVRESLARPSNAEALYVQQRVEGRREIVSFAAHHGRLVESVLLREERLGTQTFATDRPPTDVQTALKKLVSDAEWTGGGALHFVVCTDETRWYDGLRPCFGPEVALATQGGANLPAQLVETAGGGPSSATPASVEPPAVVTLPHIERDRPLGAPSPHASPESASPPPVQFDAIQTDEPEGTLDTDLRAIVDDLPPDWREIDTPHSALLPERTRARFEAFSAGVDRLEAEFKVDTARVGLSLKTHPASLLIDTARDTGMLAETIHRDEVATARNHGFPLDEIVLNGPAHNLLADLDPAPYAYFGDALQDLQSLPFDPSDSIVGVRMRPPERGPSRFGVDLSCPDAMARFCDHIRSLPDGTQIGLHLHAPASTLGHDRWWRSLERVLQWGRTIQERTDRSIDALDLGGGWHPDDWLDVFLPGLLDRRTTILEALPELRVLLVEPGKALSQPLGVVISRVVDVRPRRSEVVLDASLAELSNIDYHPHRLLAYTADRGWHRLPRGEGTLLGRLCMEADVLGRARRVEHLSPGDTVVICDAGAYDMSMAYPFGRGHSYAGASGAGNDATA